MRQMQILQALNMVNDVFLEEMNECSNQQSHDNGRIGRFILIAAIISVLGFSVLASEYILPTDYWFYSFFADESKTQITDILSANQQEILDRGLAEINQSVTDNGWTITLESGISDGYRMFIKYRIDAPQGTVLNAENYSVCNTTDMRPPKGEVNDYSAGYYTDESLTDDNPNDNSVSKLIEYILIPPDGTGFSIADGTVWTITFHSIVEESRSLDEYTQTTMCEGNWTFKVVFTDDLLVTKSSELLETPIYCSAKRYFRNKKFDIKVKVTSFELRALTATVRYDKPVTGFWDGIMLDPIYVVLKDGTRIEAHFKMELNRHDHAERIMTFDRPVSIEDVAYIDFPHAGEVSIPSDR